MRPLAIPFRGRILGYPMVLRPASGSASFSPTDISGLVAWYDFSDITTLFQDSARTTPVTADADRIGGVTDKSGSARHLGQGTASKRPTYKTAIQNSKSIGRFDGSDDVLTFTTETLTAFTLLVVSKKTSTSYGVMEWRTAGQAGFAYASETAGTWRSNLTISSAAADEVSNTKNNAAAEAVPTAFHLDIWDSAPTLRVNGASATTAAGGGGWGARGGGQVGRFYNNFNGDIGEILVYNSALSAANKQTLETYINTKWAVY